MAPRNQTNRFVKMLDAKIPNENHRETFVLSFLISAGQKEKGDRKPSKY